MTTFTHSFRSAWRFFQRNAGGIVGESALTAMALARAEQTAANLGMRFVWETDHDAEASWLDQPGFEDAKAEYERGDMPCEWARAELDDEDGSTTILASLGGIFGADSNYRRIVEAELALEALATIDQEGR